MWKLVGFLRFIIYYKHQILFRATPSIECCTSFRIQLNLRSRLVTIVYHLFQPPIHPSRWITSGSQLVLGGAFSRASQWLVTTQPAWKNHSMLGWLPLIIIGENSQDGENGDIEAALYPSGNISHTGQHDRYSMVQQAPLPTQGNRN